MPKLPPQVERSEVSSLLEHAGFRLFHQGKVRNTHLIPDLPKWLLVHASDRISVFDHVLPFLVPGKGAVLTAMNHFWCTQVLSDIPHHLVMHRVLGKGNAAKRIQQTRLPDLPLETCLVVERAQVHSYEYIFRGHGGGSIWKEYVEKGTMAGVPMPANLRKWERMPEPAFTPSTKATEGHDQNITVEKFMLYMGEAGVAAANLGKSIYARAYEYALERGIAILDTKFEFAWQLGNHGASAMQKILLVDEALTPDSSRYTTVEDVSAAVVENRDPVFYDKQVVRDWAAHLTTPFGFQGIRELDEDNQDHWAYLINLEPPLDLIEETTRRYRWIFEKITGTSLEDYQRDAMHAA